MGFFNKLFGRSKPTEPLPTTAVTLGMAELSRRLGVDATPLLAVKPVYHPFEIPKRTGGHRRILAPAADLKNIQRLLLRCVLKRLPAHESAHGFEAGRSIVTNAREHTKSAVVVRLDVKDFFASTPTDKVERYFRSIGWDEPTAALLTKLTTHEGGLPQGAPTSPRLSNLVNQKLDTRLAALATKFGAAYTRYADDLTFSFKPVTGAALPGPKQLIRAVKKIVKDEGYRLHTDKKLRIHRRHDSQRVTGLVVNEVVQLPRATRRRLRAIEHHLATGKPATITAEQLQGWDSLQAMITTQRSSTGR